MQAKGIHHLDVAVEDLEEVVETYRSVFGAELEHRETMPSQGVEAVAVRVGGSRVEFLRAYLPERFKSPGTNVNIGTRGDVFVPQRGTAP